jgi:hypothetical protein
MSSAVCRTHESLPVMVMVIAGVNAIGNVAKFAVQSGNPVAIFIWPKIHVC